MCTVRGFPPALDEYSEKRLRNPPDRAATACISDWIWQRNLNIAKRSMVVREIINSSSRCSVTVWQTYCARLVLSRGPSVVFICHFLFCIVYTSRSPRHSTQQTSDTRLSRRTDTIADGRESVPATEIARARDRISSYTNCSYAKQSLSATCSLTAGLTAAGAVFTEQKYMPWPYGAFILSKSKHANPSIQTLQNWVREHEVIPIKGSRLIINRTNTNY